MGIVLLAAFALALVGLLEAMSTAQQRAQPLATVTPVVKATGTPELPPLLENIQIARRYPLEVEGKVLEDNPWGLYYVPVWSPDGTGMLFRRPRPLRGEGVPCKGWACGMILCELWRTDARGGSPQLLAERVGGVAWSPDGKWIAYTQHTPTGESSLWIMRSDGSKTQKLMDDIGSSRLGWLNESTIVYINSSGSLISMSLDKRSVKQFRLSQIPRVTRFAISPQGDCLALATEAEVWLVNLEKPEEPISITPYYGAFEGSIAWSPDGSKVAYSSRSSIYIVDRDGKLIANVKTVWQPSDLAWSPDGKVLAFRGRTEERGLSFEIYLLDAENKRVKQLTDDREGNIAPGGKKYSLTWSPDGSRLIYGTSRLLGQKVQVIELTTNTSQGKGYDKAHVDDAEGKILLPFSLGAQNSRSPVLSDCPYQEGNRQADDA